MNEQINEAVRIATYGVQLRRTSGWEELHFTQEQILRYNADPDAFAARYFGFATADEYREWIELEGQALCAGLTKLGRQCKSSVGAGQLDPAEWKRLHRVDFCAIHKSKFSANNS